MAHELLTPREMGEADRLTVALGPLDGMELMRRAGASVAAAALRHHSGSAPVHVLAGPGNNGGDGYVAAGLLDDAGLDVRLWRSEPPRRSTDAGAAAAECRLKPGDLADFCPENGALVIDALFGAGLSGPLGGLYAVAAERTCACGADVLAVDLPSGISGESGAVLGTAFKADRTVTFFRRKPGHLLFPGRAHCGEVSVEDIGIPASVLEMIEPRFFENMPALWLDHVPRPPRDAHKYSRGHVAVF
ncbi:MAG: bifunctional ADP-dependent (S)-NAD(P)H-hydrate dehydratase/NAD(P)H-hydrate epimerase, partial [Rhizobiaceae bacterium]|nr:bifunctional ADP-dependent (S)-NAD(P)H-hydrate dehydratase/NAD(P)H-hydrate epimerase [Rhizobiaceae bacterium]